MKPHISIARGIIAFMMVLALAAPRSSLAAQWSPTQLGIFNQTIGPPLTAATMSGKWIYTAQERKLIIYDNSTAGAPVVTGRLSLPVASTRLDVSGGVLAAMESTARKEIALVDIRTASAPRVLRARLGGPFYAMALYGQTLCALAPDAAVKIFDITNPASPVLKSTYLSPAPVQDIALSGNVLITVQVDSNGYRFQFVDTSNPAVPVRKGGIDDLGTNDVTHHGWAVAGNVLYTLSSHLDYSTSRRDMNCYIGIFDFSNPAAPVRKGQVTENGYLGRGLKGLTASGDILLLAHTNAFGPTTDPYAIYDISNRLSPVQKGSCADYGTMAINASTAVGYTPDGFTVLNLTNLAAPVVKASRRMRLNITDVELEGTMAYVNQEGTLLLVDVSTSSTPVLKGSLALGAKSYTVSGKHVYAACGATGLQIVDATNPAAPRIEGRLPSVRDAVCVATSGSLAFVGNDKGVQIINVINPANPRLKSSFALQGIQEIGVMGHQVIVACAPSGLQVLDVSNPARPRLQGSFAQIQEGPYAKLALAPANRIAYFVGAGGKINNITIPMLYTLRIPETGAPVKLGFEVQYTPIINPPTALVYGDKTLAVAQPLRLDVYDAKAADAPATMGASMPDKYPILKVVPANGLFYVVAREAGLRIWKND